MTIYAIITNQSFSFGNNSILEWFILTSVSPTFKKKI